MGPIDQKEEQETKMKGMQMYVKKKKKNGRQKNPNAKPDTKRKTRALEGWNKAQNQK
jgi:hypothetical protein